MSWIYDRTISINRPNSVSPVTTIPPSVRNLPYQGVTPSQETQIYSGLPASIQYSSGNRQQDNSVPTDVPPGLWKILIPLSAAAQGTINRRDIVIDDVGTRYQIGDGDYFTPLGYQLSCKLLEL